jgi:hypothetical protein
MLPIPTSLIFSMPTIMIAPNRTGSPSIKLRRRALSGGMLHNFVNRK